jgi:hypothetical protein
MQVATMMGRAPVCPPRKSRRGTPPPREDVAAKPVGGLKHLSELPPVISPEQAESDRSFFHRKYGIDPDAERRERDNEQIKMLHSQGWSWQAIGREMGINQDTARARVDAKFRLRRNARDRANWNAKQEGKKAA